MRTVGIIAEYNPFHPGHAYHLREARRLSGADCVAVVMSGCFTQRGEAAALSPSVRARMALTQGADIVFALPVCWAARDAERFALGGVRLLQLLGADAVSFGAEDAHLPRLSSAAALLENNEALAPGVRRHRDAGLPYPAALAEAAEELSPGVGPLLASPNNTLAVCYLRAMQRLGFAAEAFPVARRGDYRATAMESMPSATAVRGALHRGDWQGLRRALGEETFALLEAEAMAGRIHRPEGLDQALLYRLRTMTDAEWQALPDLSEGVEDRLRKAAQAASTREELLQAAKTRRYPYARLSRLCTHALLGMTAAQLAREPLPDALLLLGFTEAARPLLTRLKHSGAPLVSKAADTSLSAQWFQTEKRAYDLWALGCGQSAGLMFRQGVAVL